jgi:hypothetical protein
LRLVSIHSYGRIQNGENANPTSDTINAGCYAADVVSGEGDRCKNGFLRLFYKWKELMGRRLNTWIVAALRPPLLIIGFVARVIYRPLFGWYDRKLAREGQEDLAEDIQTYISFVFRELEGQIVPNEGESVPPPFDYAVVTIEASPFRLKFTRGRGGLAVQLAPRFSPRGWHELSTVLNVLDVPGVKRGSIASLTQAGDLMRQHIVALTKAHTEGYPQLKRQLMEIYERDQIIRKQIETEINRRIYG